MSRKSQKTDSSLQCAREFFLLAQDIRQSHSNCTQHIARAIADAWRELDHYYQSQERSLIDELEEQNLESSILQDIRQTLAGQSSELPEEPSLDLHFPLLDKLLRRQESIFKRYPLLIVFALLVLPFVLSFLISLTRATPWTAEYFPNIYLRGKPTVLRQEEVLSHEWRSSAPAPGLPPDNFSARYSATLLVTQNSVVGFSIGADDGVKFYIDDIPVFDAWAPTGDLTAVHTFQQNLDSGRHSLRLEYFELWGDANISLSINSANNDFLHLEQAKN